MPGVGARMAPADVPPGRRCGRGVSGEGEKGGLRIQDEFYCIQSSEVNL